MSIAAAASRAMRVAMELLSRQPKMTAVRGVGDVPFHRPAGMAKLCFVSIASLYVGGLIAHKGASYLEENEIFVPEDDDDDDD